MKRTIVATLLLLALLPLLTACSEDLSATPNATNTVQSQAALTARRVERGRFLVGIGGCNDCHTPLKMGANGPEPDMSRMLSGHPHDLVMPPAPKINGPWMYVGGVTNTAFSGPWGVSYARNLTPDQVSGLGIWDEQMFVKTIRTGRHMGVSRPLLPPMPWQNINQALTSDEDLKSIYAYLRTIKPIRNEVPDAIVAPPHPAPHS